MKSEEEKQAYIDQYLEHEGILLDKECIDKNPGLRSLSKLALNSFYGKFGQRTNMKKTLFVKDIKQLMQVWCGSMPLVRRGLTPSLLLIVWRSK